MKSIQLAIGMSCVGLHAGSVVFNFGDVWNSVNTDHPDAVVRCIDTSL